METRADLCREARKLGREFVIRGEGQVAERSNKNPQSAEASLEASLNAINRVQKGFALYAQARYLKGLRITSYNVCYTKLLRSPLSDVRGPS